MDTASLTLSLIAALPEVFLACSGLVILLVGVYSRAQATRTAMVLAVAALLGTLALLLLGPARAPFAFNDLFVNDGFGDFMKVLILVAAALTLVISFRYMRGEQMDQFEYPVLIVFSVVGMLMMVSANDLISLYIGLELQSLALYVVAALRRDTLRSSEAGLKYFVLGALSSGMLLYGMSLVYGFTGTTSFTALAELFAAQAAAGEGLSLGALIGLVFVTAGLAFKISAVPFHMWTPDVYQGAPTPITAFFATAPKMAAMGLFARVVHDAYGGVVTDWQQVLAVLSLLSMFLGAVAAIGQTDIKRLMAYSSIAHMGYALMGLAAGTAFGVQAMLIYMAIYITMNIGTFAFILSMERDGQPVTDIASLNMYSKAHPGRAMAMLILLFSLAGVPPLLGFFGKLYVLRAAYDAGLAWLAVAGVIASVIGAFYYLRIVFYMYFGEEREALETARSPVQWGFLMVSAAIMLLGIVNMFGVEGIAQAAAATLVN